MSSLRLVLQEREPLNPLQLHCEAFWLDREAARCTTKTLAH